MRIYIRPCFDFAHFQLGEMGEMGKMGKMGKIKTEVYKTCSTVSETINWKSNS